MKALRILLAVAALATLAAPRLYAQPMGHGPGSGRGPRPFVRGLPGDADAPGLLVPLLLGQSDLDETQRQRIHQIMEADRSTLRALFAELEAANEALAARLVSPGTLDTAALQPDIDRVAAARRKLMEHGLATAIALRNVLTPDQLARVAKTRTRLQELQREMDALLRGD